MDASGGNQRHAQCPVLSTHFDICLCLMNAKVSCNKVDLRILGCSYAAKDLVHFKCGMLQTHTTITSLTSQGSLDTTACLIYSVLQILFHGSWRLSCI